MLTNDAATLNLRVTNPIPPGVVYKIFPPLNQNAFAAQKTTLLRSESDCGGNKNGIFCTWLIEKKSISLPDSIRL